MHIVQAVRLVTLPRLSSSFQVYCGPMLPTGVTFDCRSSNTLLLARSNSPNSMTNDSSSNRHMCVHLRVIYVTVNLAGEQVPR